MPNLTGPDQRVWLERLAAEHDNLRAALAWSIDGGDANLALRLGGALWRFWAVRGFLAEGRTWLDRALRLPVTASPDVMRALALNGAGNFANLQGDFPAARTYHEESLAIRSEIGDRLGVAFTMHGVAYVSRSEGQLDRAVKLLGAVDALRTSLGAPLSPKDRAESDDTVAMLRAALGEEAFATAWAAGQAVTLDEAVALALGKAP